MIKVEEPSKHKENKTIYNTGTVKDIANLIAESWSKSIYNIQMYLNI